MNKREYVWPWAGGLSCSVANCSTEVAYRVDGALYCHAHAPREVRGSSGTKWGPWKHDREDVYRESEGVSPPEIQLVDPDYLNALERKNAIAVAALKEIGETCLDEQGLTVSAAFVDQIEICASRALTEMDAL